MPGWCRWVEYFAEYFMELAFMLRNQWIIMALLAATVASVPVFFVVDAVTAAMGYGLTVLLVFVIYYLRSRDWSR